MMKNVNSLKKFKNVFKCKKISKIFKPTNLFQMITNETKALPNANITNNNYNGLKFDEQKIKKSHNGKLFKKQFNESLNTFQRTIIQTKLSPHRINNFSGNVLQIRKYTDKPPQPNNDIFVSIISAIFDAIKAVIKTVLDCINLLLEIGVFLIYIPILILKIFLLVSLILIVLILTICAVLCTIDICGYKIEFKENSWFNYDGIYFKQHGKEICAIVIINKIVYFRMNGKLVPLEEYFK